MKSADECKKKIDCIFHEWKLNSRRVKRDIEHATRTHFHLFIPVLSSSQCKSVDKIPRSENYATSSWFSSHNLHWKSNLPVNRHRLPSTGPDFNCVSSHFIGSLSALFHVKIWICKIAHWWWKNKSWKFAFLVCFSPIFCAKKIMYFEKCERNQNSTSIQAGNH